MPNKQYKSFDRQSAKELRNEIDKVLSQLEKFGITASVGTITYETNEIRTKLTIRPKVTASSVKVGKNTDFTGMTNRQVFDALNGRTVSLTDGKPYKLVDFKSQNRKYPFIVQGPKGGRYKVSRSQLAL